MGFIAKFLAESKGERMMEISQHSATL